MMRSLAMFVLVVGCSTPQEELVGKPPDTGKVVEQPAQQPEPPSQMTTRHPTPRLTIAGWPYHEPGNTFELTWSGGAKPAPLHAAPDYNSRLLGDVVWDNGEPIKWIDSVVASYQPRVVKATAEWFVEGPVFKDGFLVDQEFVSIETKPGDRVEVWAYGGDLQCYMSKQSQIFSGPCPPGDRFSGLGQGPIPGTWYEPKQRAWWIRISGSISGWVPVDDRMTVDIIGG